MKTETDPTRMQNHSPTSPKDIKSKENKSQKLATLYNDKQKTIENGNVDVPSSNNSMPSNDAFDLGQQISIIGKSIEENTP